MHKYEDFEWAPPEDLARLAQGELPWGHYLATAVHFDAGTVRPADGSDGAPPLGPLHVVTAVQPDSDPDSPDSAARMAVLDRELASRGITALRVAGASFDGSHREDSRAIFGLDDDEARGLGLRFGQVAIFSWRGPRWSVLACVSARFESRGWRWDSAI
jgi:hypothetical protein